MRKFFHLDGQRKNNNRTAKDSKVTEFPLACSTTSSLSEVRGTSTATRIEDLTTRMPSAHQVESIASSITESNDASADPSPSPDPTISLAVSDYETASAFDSSDESNKHSDGAQVNRSAGRPSSSRPSVKSANSRPSVNSNGSAASSLRSHSIEPLDGAPDPENFVDWPDRPLLVRVNPSMTYLECSAADDWGRVPINTGSFLDIDSPSFSGRAKIFIKGLPTSPPGLFQGMKRKDLIVVQGRFKLPMPVEDLLSGQEFFRPAVNLPNPWIVENVLLRIASAVSPSMKVGPLSAPYMLFPVIAGAQAISVNRPGEEPDINPATVEEDVRLFAPEAANRDGTPWRSDRRKRYFASPKHRHGRFFDTQHVWTFYVYQHVVDLTTYEANMVLRFNLLRHTNGQPLQLFMKNCSTGEYLFNFQLWHEHLLGRSALCHRK